MRLRSARFSRRTSSSLVKDLPSRTRCASRTHALHSRVVWRQHDRPNTNHMNPTLGLSISTHSANAGLAKLMSGSGSGAGWAFPRLIRKAIDATTDLVAAGGCGVPGIPAASRGVVGFAGGARPEERQASCRRLRPRPGYTRSVRPFQDSRTCRRGSTDRSPEHTSRVSYACAHVLPGPRAKHGPDDPPWWLCPVTVAALAPRAGRDARRSVARFPAAAWRASAGRGSICRVSQSGEDGFRAAAQELKSLLDRSLGDGPGNVPKVLTTGHHASLLAASNWARRSRSQPA